MKYIFIIEHQDNHGEFQPFGGGYYLSRESADDALHAIRSMTGGKFRVVQYTQKINRS
jgi:hypothetical protein